MDYDPSVPGKKHKSTLILQSDPVMKLSTERWKNYPFLLVDEITLDSVVICSGAGRSVFDGESSKAA